MSAGAPPNQHPTAIGTYAVLRFLGEGGAGRVYACRDKALARDVAIKLLRTQVAIDPIRRDRFLREGRMMARVQSAHVAQVFSVGEQEGVPFLVMELLGGQDLESHLREHGPLPPADALRIARQACLGLDAAAHIGVIHRDIKPANIVLTPRGAKLTDFGLARPQDGSSTVTSEGLVTGTPAFLAPERAMAKGDDSRSDMYSLGATLYTLLAGHPPFERPSPIEVITAHLREEAPVLEKVAPKVARTTAELVRRMMSKDPAGRFQTYAELIEAIDGALFDLEGELTSVNDPFGAPSTSSQFSATVGAPTGVMGSLAQMTLGDIVQMLEIGRKTAGVDIEPTAGNRGVVSVEAGQVVFASFEDLLGAEAFYALHRIQDGSFRIRYGRDPEGKNVNIPTQFLLLEAMRRVDEESRDWNLPDTGQTPQPVSALDQPLGRSAGASTDVGSSIPDDPLAPRDTLVVAVSEQPERDRTQNARTVLSPTQTETGTQRGEVVEAPLANPFVLGDDKTEAMEAFTGLDDRTAPMQAVFALDEATSENLAGSNSLLDDGNPDITEPEQLPSHSTPETVGNAPALATPFEGTMSKRTARSIASGALMHTDDDVTLAQPQGLARLFMLMPWLKQLDDKVLRAARTSSAALREKPWLLAVGVLPLIMLILIVAAVAVSQRGSPDPMARIAAGDAQAVLDELAQRPALSGPQELVRAHALIAVGKAGEAVIALRKAVETNDVDDTTLEWVVLRLDRDEAGPEVDLLVAWPDGPVTAALLRQSEREAYNPRRHAITALTERGEAGAVDAFAVAVKDLRDAPTCPIRRNALRVLKDMAKKLDKGQAKEARAAVERAAKLRDNECMTPILAEMMPDKYRR